MQAIGGILGGLLFPVLGVKLPQQILDNPLWSNVAAVVIGGVAGVALIFAVRLAYYWAIYHHVESRGGLIAVVRNMLGAQMEPVLLMVAGVVAFFALVGGGAVWAILRSANIQTAMAGAAEAHTAEVETLKNEVAALKAAPPTPPAPLPPPQPPMSASEAERKIDAVDAALKLLREDVQPAIKGIRADLRWGGPRGSEDTIDARTTWINEYYAKLSPAEERLNAARSRIQQFVKQNQQWDDVRKAMSFSFGTDIDYDVRDYIHGLGEVPQAAKSTPMDSLGRMVLGHIKKVEGQLSALDDRIDEAANTLLGIRSAAIIVRQKNSRGIILTDDQKRLLFREIQGFAALEKNLIIAYPDGHASSQTLAFQYRNFFKENTTVDAGLAHIRLEDPRYRGIMVAVQNVVDPPQAAVSLHRALIAAGIDARIVSMPQDTFKSPYLLLIGPL